MKTYTCKLCIFSKMDRIDKIMHYEHHHKAISGTFNKCGNCGADLREGKYLDEITNYSCDVWKYCPNCKKLNHFID